MEQNEFCPYCDHYIEEGIDAIIDFPCLHRAHSTCFFRLFNNETFSLAEEFRRCQFCEESVFEPQEQDEEEEVVEEQQEEEQIEVPEQQDLQSNSSDESLPYYERIRKRFFENQQMQKDIKRYIKAKRACGPKRAALKKYTLDKKNEIKHSVESLREQLGSLIKAQKKIILQSQPYKSYRGAHFRVVVLRAQIAKRYGIDMDSLRKAIRNEKGFKQWTKDFRWRDQPNYIIRRSFFHRYVRC